MNRDGMTLEKRVQMLEGAIDSIAPSMHALYDLVEEIRDILHRKGLTEVQCEIEKEMKQVLAEYRKRWVWGMDDDGR